MKYPSKYIEMTERPVGKLVAALALPSMGSMMVSALYNIADTWFVSRTGTQATAALGIAFTYMVLIQAVSFFFGQGSGNFISRALGAQKVEQASQIAATGFFSSMILTTCLAFSAWLFMEPVLSFFGSTPTIMPYACSYFQWLLLGTPFISCTFVMNNQMRFQGNAAMALVGILSGALLNIVLDPIFIFTLGMGVGGAGLATAISQMTSFFIMLYQSGQRGGLAPRWSNFHPSLSQYREISRSGLPSLGRQGTMGLTAMALNNVAGLYGDAAIAAFSIVNRIIMFVQSLLIGLGQGFQPVCGFNYGARKFHRVRMAFRFCTAVSTIYSIVLVVLGMSFADDIVSLFQSNDGSVIELGSRILRMQCLTYAFTGFVITSNMFLQNIGATWSALIVAISRQGLFLIPVLWILHLLYGFDGVIASQPVSDIFSLLVTIPLCWKAFQKMKQEEAMDSNKKKYNNV